MNKLKLFEKIMHSFFKIINRNNKYEKYRSINNNNGYDILKKYFIYVYEKDKELINCLREYIVFVNEGGGEYSAILYYNYYIYLSMIGKDI